MNLTLFNEILPINISQLPNQYFYKLCTAGDVDLDSLGRSIKYRIQKYFRGIWVWSTNDQLLISDKLIEYPELQKFTQYLWTDQSNLTFNQLEGIEIENIRCCTPQGIADFCSQGLIKKYDQQIKKILEQSKTARRDYHIKLIHKFGSWVVNNQPCISLSLKQEIDFNGTLQDYLTKFPNSNIIGLHVLDITKPFNTAQEVIKILGILGEGNRRQRLLTWVKEPTMKKLVEEAPDSELVVEIGNKKKSYHYIISALRIRVLNQDYLRLGISEKLQIVSEERLKYIEPLFRILQSEGFLDKVYTSQRNPELFRSCSEEWGYNPLLKFKNNATVAAESVQSTVQVVQKHGEFRKADKSEIRIAILNTLKSENSTKLIEIFRNNFKRSFNQNLEGIGNQLKYKLKLVGQPIALDLSKNSLSLLDSKIGELSKKKPDIVICVIPNFLSKGEDGRTLYDDLKQTFLKYNLQSQMLQEKTLTTSFATKNIVLGVLAKIGSVPYILQEPLTYTDFVVGLDVSRRRKKNLQGTNSVAAMTRIYSNQGELVHYSIRDATIDGEIIPKRMLYDLFPLHEYQGKRVVIHRDGNFPEEERQALEEIAEKIDAKFYFVSIIKSGNPRIYGRTKNEEGIGSYRKAPKGSIFLLSETEALLISSDFPDRFRATPQPLRIKTFGNFPLQSAVHSVLSLTYLHYGSERPPRLPVSTYYADSISTMVSKGIKPKDVDGNIPFWL
ncbi:hypothetical protein AWQ21_13885 [Picosynechococcus sp. PCC 7003]|uniref:Piwi domain-containing protein n=1 Tax=Picosynechococcus sp. PCC 7003 TaxID=374981 RepID=UPI0008105EF5|nr:Piwi domain-containing protein [Picosynechococcus sp. PCC 7003]ANV85356.1 hypothetical protein AWQ21_13885 [Picosynechococcus sp. PCC 7003]